jgi:hypothetical protein
MKAHKVLEIQVFLTSSGAVLEGLETALAKRENKAGKPPVR